jgi:hypothetical protein
MLCVFSPDHSANAKLLIESRLNRSGAAGTGRECGM